MPNFRPFAQAGFTLIELIVVIVILGVLSAVAAPRFLNLSSDAEKAVVETFVGSLITARSMFIAKTALCGGGYPTAADAVFTTYVSYDENKGWNSGCANPYNTISTELTVRSLAANPNANVVLNSTTMQLVTKSGRQVDITLNPATGNISWSATPAY